MTSNSKLQSAERERETIPSLILPLFLAHPQSYNVSSTYLARLRNYDMIVSLSTETASSIGKLWIANTAIISQPFHIIIIPMRWLLVHQALCSAFLSTIRVKIRVLKESEQWLSQTKSKCANPVPQLVSISLLQTWGQNSPVKVQTGD